MKWFKHISDSLDDPFIFDLITEFGGDGYLVFFGVLEMLSREFDPNSPGICTFSDRFLSKKLQLSRKKTVKILNFCGKKDRLLVDIKGNQITINCPKLIALCDEYTRSVLSKTQEILRSNSGIRSKKEEIRNKKQKEKQYVDRNFALSEKLIQYAIDRNIDPDKIDELRISFIDYYVEKGTKLTDWGRAWQNWVRRAPDYSKWAMIKNKPKNVSDMTKANLLVLQGKT